MAQSKIKVYQFKISLGYLDDEMWRTIELLGDATIEDLAAAVLAAFGADVDHLWSISTAKADYEYSSGNSWWGFGAPKKPILDPDEYTLADLRLRTRSRLDMTYDFGDQWEFLIRVTATFPLPEDESPDMFPRITGGEGGDIIEDIGGPYTLYQILEAQKAGQDLADVMPDYADWVGDWRYDRFDLKDRQKHFQQEVRKNLGVFGRMRSVIF